MIVFSILDDDVDEHSLMSLMTMMMTMLIKMMMKMQMTMMLMSALC